jgi:hypothetical protein
LTSFEVASVSILVILLAALLATGLVVATVLVWTGMNAILYARRITHDAAMTIAGLRRALRSIYDDTISESLPDDFLDLLGKLGRGRRDTAPLKGRFAF